MNRWQKYIAELISLNSRGKHLEQAINFRLGLHSLTPSQILEKLKLANQAKHLYQKANRIAKLLLSVGEHSLTRDVARIDVQIESNLRRIGDIVNLLNEKAEKFGLEEKTEELPDSEQPLEDVAQADDAFEDDKVRNEIKHSLKEISDLIDYMEINTLVKVNNSLKKIINS